MNITAKGCAWNDRLEALVTSLNPEIGVEAVKNQVEKNHFMPFEVFVDEVSIGFFVIRIDVTYDGKKELVHLFSLSEVKGRTPIHHVMGSLVMNIARDLGCQRVRVHSEIRKIDSFLEREGFEFRESVFVKEVSNA